MTASPSSRTGSCSASSSSRACTGVNQCKVFWLPGLPALTLEKARTDGLFSVLNAAKTINVLAQQPGGCLAAPACTATQNVLQAHPDTSVIVSSGDQMIAGAVRAAAAGGKTGIKMYGNGCTFEAKQLILTG